VRDVNPTLDLELFREAERAELRRFESQKAAPKVPLPTTNAGPLRR
jgi:hypothetical protein